MAYEGGYTSALNSQQSRAESDTRIQQALQQIARQAWVQQQEQEQKQQKQQQDIQAFSKLAQLSNPPPQPGAAQGPPPQPMAPGQPSVPMQQGPPPMGAMGGMSMAPQGAPPGQPPAPWKPSAAAPPTLGGQPPVPQPGGAGQIGAPPPAPEQAPVLPPKGLKFEEAVKLIESDKTIAPEMRMPVLERMTELMAKQDKAKLEQYKIEHEVKKAEQEAAKSAREDALIKLFGGVKPTPEMVNAYFATGDMAKAKGLVLREETRKGIPPKYAGGGAGGSGGAGGAAGAGKGMGKDDVVDFYAAQQMAGDVSWRTGLSRNKEGSALILAVDRRVPAIAKELGLSPQEIIANKGETAGDLKAMIDRSKFIATSGQFIKNLESQADLVEKYMMKGAASGVPVLNKWIQGGRVAIAGDPDVTALDTAIRGLAREHQRIVTGVTSNAQLHVAAQQTADELLNKSQAPAQMRAAIKVMREEAVNARKAGMDEMGDLRARITGRGGKKPEAPAAAGAASGGLPAGWSVKEH